MDSFEKEYIQRKMYSYNIPTIICNKINLHYEAPCFITKHGKTCVHEKSDADKGLRLL